MTSGPRNSNLFLPGLVFLLAGLAGNAGAEQAWSLQQALLAIAAVERNEIPFTESRYSTILEVPLTSEGTLRFEPPDTLIKDIERPHPERLMVTGDALHIEEADKPPREMRLADSPPLQGFVEAFRATLAGDEATLRRFYEVRLEGTRSDWKMELVPRGTKLGLTIDRVEIEGVEGRIKSFTTHKSGGDRIVLTVEPARR